MRKVSSAIWILSLTAIALFGEEPTQERVRLESLPSPILFPGDAKTAYRDPTAIYHEGVLHLYFTVCRMEEEGAFWYLGHSQSRDLVRWSKVELLTPRDRNLNFSSPGNVVRIEGKWILCLQTYPTPRNETFGNETARLWILRSDDLESWGEPELLRVKGPDVPVGDMGRMIDPYLVEDKDRPGRWWCFYKQSGMSLSSSDDGLRTWRYVGHYAAGENACVLVEDDEYVLVHSPSNGIGLKRSRDLKTWEDRGTLTLGQSEWPWSQGRLTAGFVLDLRKEPRVGRHLLFFHGSTREGLRMHRAHGHASLGIAWCDDLESWCWPGQTQIEPKVE